MHNHWLVHVAYPTRILWFSAYALTIFTEYTAWAAFGGVSWKWPKVTVYMSISIIVCLIFFLLLANQNRYVNEVLNMCIWWQQTTWVVLVPITTHIPSFINVAHTELWIFDIFVISKSEQICKWGITYVHSVTTDHMGSTCAPHYPHIKFDKNRSLRSHYRVKVYLMMLTRSVHTYICTSIHTDSVTNEN